MSTINSLLIMDEIRLYLRMVGIYMLCVSVTHLYMFTQLWPRSQTIRPQCACQALVQNCQLIKFLRKMEINWNHLSVNEAGLFILGQMQSRVFNIFLLFFSFVWAIKSNEAKPPVINYPLRNTSTNGGTVSFDGNRLRKLFCLN